MDLYIAIMHFADWFLSGTGRMPYPVGGAIGMTLSWWHMKSVQAECRIWWVELWAWLCHDDIWRGYTQFEMVISSYWIFIRHLTTLHDLYIDLDYWLWVAVCQGTQQTVLQLCLRYWVEIFKCTNASELIKLRRSPCGLHILWRTVVHVHIATEVLVTLHPRATGLCFMVILVGDIDGIN